MREIDAVAARAAVHSGQEVAFLDVREAGQFGEGHALFAVPAPYSRLEAAVPGLVPRPHIDILLIDDGDGVAHSAARALDRLGYTAVSVVAGGMSAWVAAGFPVYKGVNVSSKMLGELAETAWHPEMVKPQTLHDWRRSGRPFRLFDARPPEEYARMRVPGAVCLPNGELAHRLNAAGLDKEQPVVVTCAGRTRGIVGAIGLRLAGHKVPVFALENGTQGWALAGFDLERGNKAEPYPPLPGYALEEAKARARAICDRFGIPLVTAAEADRLLHDQRRTTYLFDVRSREEALRDRVPEAVHAPSGQLVQATDQWVGVRRSRLILIDDGGLRAALAAFWLAQLGYTVHVALIDDAMRRVNRPEGAAPRERAPVPRKVDAADALRDVRSERGCFIDLRSSLAYRREHVDGAVWSIRPRLLRAAAPYGDRRIHLIADDQEIACFAVDDLRASGFHSAFVVEGSHAALVAAGAACQSSPDEPPDRKAIDHLFFVHDRHDGNLEASRHYLAWETGLVDQLDALEHAEFRLFEP
ncbi:rhodanese-like domain-containing protein [Chelativorans salis]|uniref:Rhodanese-like domain-containing protein n=1 Tax=Chelativorans salis TaxID=2978478 RepID=A0ABT2LTR1_9HYPH|nr:rhodanese-like domain-containing protein [Chelativorans sp. EGI FJ00035]MCT7376758.1 rhodanese-like domain-containing protein [Chelativorans sp. EGI FJ00035]